MKNKYFYLVFLFFLLSANPIFAGRCTGSSGCSACTTCSSCEHCNSGGSCGVCGGGSSGGGFGKIVLIGGGILFLLWLFGDSNGNKKSL